MRYCPRCKIDVFGGSLCDRCGGRLVEKKATGKVAVVHMTQDMILGPKKRLRSELAQSSSGRAFRLVLEVLLFCGLFLGASWVGHHITNFLSINMSEDPDKARLNPPIVWWSTGFRYYWLYPGWVIVTLLTIKFRSQAGK
ncbi:MAG: hypothetical protein JW889_14385 [Verrucomicrobia bacterium]|nr:hypothetical protein [Verrucomicrobiota bacterium]